MPAVRLKTQKEKRCDLVRCCSWVSQWESETKQSGGRASPQCRWGNQRVEFTGTVNHGSSNRRMIVWGETMRVATSEI